jgi:hypothetical protein
MSNFFSNVWNFIDSWFSWILIGVGFVIAINYLNPEPHLHSKPEKNIEELNVKRKNLFILIALGIVAGFIAPFYFQTPLDWTAPINFWGGLLVFYSITLY